jgi:cardiolipin synthase (CMP-forming)
MFKKARIKVKENLTISNFLTSVRLIGALLMPFVFARLSRKAFISYFGLLCLTDLLDGYLARTFKQVTTLGKFLDAIADRFYAFMIVITLLLHAKVSIFILFLTVQRELLSIPAIVYTRIKNKNYVANAGIMGKITTNIQFFTFGLLIIMASSAYTLISAVLTAIFGVTTAVIYTYRTGAFKFLTSYFKKVRNIPFVNSK